MNPDKQSSDEYEKYILVNMEGKVVTVEVNWSEKESIAHAQMLRITFPEQDPVHVKKKDWHNISFLIANAGEKPKFIPQNIVKKRRFEGLVHMKATKDIMKGEEIITRCFHDLPDQVEERLGLPQVKDLAKV